MTISIDKIASMRHELGLETDLQIKLLTQALPHAALAMSAGCSATGCCGENIEKQRKNRLKNDILNRWKLDPEMQKLATAVYNESPKKFFFAAPVAWLLGQAVAAVFSWLVWRVLDYMWSRRKSYGFTE